MKLLITEQQLDNLAYRFVLDKLDNLDFKFKKYKEFSFFPKGTHDADNGIEADWVKDEGYHILVGNSLFRSVRDLFGLTDDQTKESFKRALIERGLKKIAELDTLDFSPYIDQIFQNESIIKESKLEDEIIDYIDELFDVTDIHSTNPLEDDDETGEEWEDENRVVFYIGDYEGEDEGCFYWYDCEYFNPNSPASEKCPMVSVEIQYEKQLNGYFGDRWKEPFKKWFKYHFELPVKTID